MAGIMLQTQEDERTLSLLTMTFVNISSCVQFKMGNPPLRTKYWTIAILLMLGIFRSTVCDKNVTYITFFCFVLSSIFTKHDCGTEIINMLSVT